MSAASLDGIVNASRFPSHVRPMDRKFIIEQIVEVSRAIGGKSPGRRRFERLTGVKEADWSGKYWARWGDALQEAGLQQNEFNDASDKSALAASYVRFVEELGHIPTEPELRMKSRGDKSFPSHNTFRKAFESKQGTLRAALRHAKENYLPPEVVELIDAAITPVSYLEEVDSQETVVGFVYLMKSGRHYKIGKTNSPDRRQYEIGLQLPSKIEPLHSIRTDDPSGIEAYWHNRFKDKHLNGEWFALTIDDVRAFKKRRFM